MVTKAMESLSADMTINPQVKLEKDTSYKGLWTVSFTLKEF